MRTTARSRSPRSTRGRQGHRLYQGSWRAGKRVIYTGKVVKVVESRLPLTSCARAMPVHISELAPAGRQGPDVVKEGTS